MLTKPEDVERDRRAIRMGDEPAGWVVIFMDGFIPDTQWRAVNQLFHDERTAVAYATGIAPERMPRVQALRRQDRQK